MIITDESKLRAQCEDASLDEAQDIIKKLEEELRQSAMLGRPGIGLAAIQIGIAKNVAIVRVPANGPYDAVNIDLVNCDVTQGYDSIFVAEEGCLSFPGKFARTKRYNEILVENNAVEPHFFVVTGLAAVCCQHELDHLKGVLLPDVALDW